MKIRTIIYTRIVFVAVGIVATAAFLIGAWHSDSQDKAIATVGSLASAVAQNMSGHIADTEIMLGLIARRPPVRALDPSSCDDGMKLVLDSDPAHASIFLADAAGRVICGVGLADPVQMPRLTEREWFGRVMAENRFIDSKPIAGRVSGLLLVIFAYPVRDDTGRPIGSINLSRELSKLQPVFHDVALPPDTAISVIDRDGVVISHRPETDWIGRNIADHPIVQSALAGTIGTGIGRSLDDLDVVYGYKNIPKASWVAIVSQPVDTVLAQTRAQSVWAIAIAGGILAAFIFAALVMSQRITRQMAQIVATARAVAAGDLNARMVVPQLEEFALIARQFNEMLDARKNSEHRILKLNRLYAALSQTNHAITNVADRATLLTDVCRISVKHGQLALAWIGFLDPGEGRVVPEAHFGVASPYIDNLRIVLDPTLPTGQGPTARAIRDGRPAFASDMWADADPRSWRAAAHASGLRACGAFPIRQDGKVVGVINLYSQEPDYFDDPEFVQLATEMAADLSFGLDSLRREDLRRETEVRFRQITESIREVFWLTDPTKNKMLYISPTYRDIWGRDPDDLYVSPKNWLDAIHESDRARVLDAAMTKQISGTYDEEYRIVRPDGSIRWIHDRAFPIHDANGAVYRISGIAEDVTDRKLIEDALRTSEATLAAAQELAQLGSWERDLATGGGRWSDTMYRLLNFDLNLGVPSFEEYLAHVDPGDRQEAIESHARVSQTGKESFVEFRTAAAFGRVRQLRSTIAPTKNSAGEVVGYRGILLDITQIKDAEARLFQAQKMEALGNLAGGIAHDFNNMLLPILNLAEMSAEDLPTDHPVQENLAMMIEAATRASQLVKQILAFGRRSERTVRPIDIADGIEGALRLLRNTLPSTIRVVDQIEKGTGIVQVDPAELHSVILNLGTNAAHAMGGKRGVLTIHVSRFRVDTGLAGRHRALVPDQWFAKIIIADTGHGMDAATLEKIFNPFFTTKPVGEGTGLGLAMVHGIVESMGGAIDVASEVGIGTTFAIYLPLDSNSAVVAA